MMKKTILLAVLAVSLTGCIVSPYDDHPRHSDRNGHYDKQHGDRDWKHSQRPHWDNDRSNRDRGHR